MQESEEARKLKREIADLKEERDFLKKKWQRYLAEPPGS